MDFTSGGGLSLRFQLTGKNFKFQATLGFVVNETCFNETSAMLRQGKASERQSFDIEKRTTMSSSPTIQMLVKIVLDLNS